LADWWTTIQEVGADERHAMVASSGKRKRGKPRQHKVTH
jgi:hypothetical protein